MRDNNARFWIVVGSPDNFAKSREIGFTQHGLKSRHRKRAEQMKPGDKIVFYVTGLKSFAGISTITSDYFESHDQIWSSNDPKKAAEDYPHRVRTEPFLILPERDFVGAEPIAREMAYVAKWSAANWTLAFQGNIHEIGETDYKLIETAIRERAQSSGN